MYSGSENIDLSAISSKRVLSKQHIPIYDHAFSLRSLINIIRIRLSYREAFEVFCISILNNTARTIWLQFNDRDSGVRDPA